MLQKYGFLAPYDLCLVRKGELDIATAGAASKFFHWQLTFRTKSFQWNTYLPETKSENLILGKVAFLAYSLYMWPATVSTYM